MSWEIAMKTLVKVFNIPSAVSVEHRRSWSYAGFVVAIDERIPRNIENLEPGFHCNFPGHSWSVDGRRSSGTGA